MKKNVIMMAAMALMMVGTMSACAEKNPYPGYEKNQNGLYYQFYTQNQGEQPQIGELVDVAIKCFVNDSVYPISNMEENTMKLVEPLFAGDLFEGIAMMHKGDTASFIVNIDSTFLKMFGQSSLPEGFLSTDVMRFDIRLDDYYPESEFPQHYAKRMKKETDKRIAQMKSNHPAETEQAASELADYLAENNIVAEPTESGLYYVVTEPGNGEKPEVGKPVTMHYTGKLIDGTVFDSSVERDQPFQFILGVGQVIPGWDEGVQLMTKGEKGMFYIPYYLAYGDSGVGEIPPFSNLIFEVELIDFETLE